MTQQKAASQSKMNLLHDRVADIFLRVLQKYNSAMDVTEGMITGQLDKQEITDEVLNAFIEQGTMPSPAMMSAITKFLKDNEVLFEKEKLEELSAQQRALAEKRKNRPDLGTLVMFPGAAEA